MASGRPALVVLSTLFPSAQEPVAGIFIKERMFRVARRLPVTVVAPQPWFPLQSLIRQWRPGYRPERALFEIMDGVEVHRPRFFSIPGVLRRFDGFWVAVAARGVVKRLMREGRADILDVHFGYPDGYAGCLLARWCRLPFVVTLRGKEDRLRRVPAFALRMEQALSHAAKVIAVSSALRQVGIELRAHPGRSMHIGNGIDLDKFCPLPKADARSELGLNPGARVLVSVGGVGERKGFHRVIEVMRSLLPSHPSLVLLIVGGPSPDGDWTPRLKEMVREHGLDPHVRFLGEMPPESLRTPLSAADVFVLATRYEGWANVFLEAMACGLPVVTTRVGGNDEVVCREDLGIVVPFGDPQALAEAIDRALRTPWSPRGIRQYAEENSWDRRIDLLVKTFSEVFSSARSAVH